MTIALVLQVLQRFNTWDGVKVGGHQRHQDDPQRTPEGQRGADMVRSSTLCIYIYIPSFFIHYIHKIGVNMRPICGFALYSLFIHNSHHLKYWLIDTRSLIYIYIYI